MLNSEKLLEKLYKIKTSKTPLLDFDNLINEVKADILTDKVSVGKGFASRRIKTIKSMLEKGIKTSPKQILFHTKQYEWEGKKYQIVMIDGCYGLVALADNDKMDCLPSYEEYKEERKLGDFPNLDKILILKKAYNINVEPRTGKYLYEAIRLAKVNNEPFAELDVLDYGTTKKCYYDKNLLNKVLLGLNIKEDTKIILRFKMNYAEKSAMVIEVEGSNSFGIILPCKKEN
jgi:hypothetical protein